MPDKLLKSGWHWQFGWLRRPEEDCEYGYCYEAPDGDLVYSSRMDHRIALYLDCREDTFTGEKYLCLNKFPTKIHAGISAMKKRTRTKVKGKYNGT